MTYKYFSVYMNFFVYVLSIFGSTSICKKVVKNSDFGEGDWVAGYINLLIVLSTSIIFSAALLSKEHFHFIGEQVGA